MTMKYREWLLYDFDCENKSDDASKFISHIALYMNNNKPFKCKLCNQCMVEKLEMKNYMIVYKKNVLIEHTIRYQ